jgi:antitoxin (DNA-binding transcriptional repressor) of toxin-antitoxin stability system
MKQVSVGDFKAHFSGWLEAVRRGERVAIQYGRRKEIVAVLTPPPRRSASGSTRRLGVLKDRARFKLGVGFKLTEAELLGA